MTFRAVDFPSQCAFVPSARVTLSGTKPCCFANASYVSVVEGFRYLFSFQHGYQGDAQLSLRHNILALSNRRPSQHCPERRKRDMLIVSGRTSLAAKRARNGAIDGTGNFIGLSSLRVGSGLER